LVTIVTAIEERRKFRDGYMLEFDRKYRVLRNIVKRKSKEIKEKCKDIEVQIW